MRQVIEPQYQKLQYIIAVHLDVELVLDSDVIEELKVFGDLKEL